ncbi:MAG: iron-containing alcohol dehydrogenase [Actinobacteria bacterium]|nr:iron-containing alcohol dehydrogenase [Actinomycetota bacterium]
MASSLINYDPTMLAPHDWGFPVPIAYGPGRLSEIGQRCVALGIKNPLIVTDRGSRNLEFISRLQSFLGESGLKSALFFEISPNPIDTEIGAGRTAFRSGKHDAIIAIGGGSAMDGGKAICLTANNDLDLWDFEFEQTAPKIASENAFPKLITIPTTAGTGAETESTGMVTDSAKAMKFCVWHPNLKPSLALLDPELTVGLPANMTAWTGADALVHAIEAFLVPGFNPLCDALALEALSLISTWLPGVVAEPQNITARGGMHVGSCLAGISFLKGLGLVHAISHMIGAEFNTHHGLTNAIILPVVLRFNLPGMEDKVRRMAEAMKLPDHSVNGFITAVEAILDEIKIPKSLSEIGVPLDCVERISTKALKDSAARTNPRSATLAEVQALTQSAIVNAR